MPELLLVNPPRQEVRGQRVVQLHAERRRPRSKALQRVLGAADAGLRLLELLGQDRAEGRKLLALQIRGDIHQPLGNGVDRGRRDGGVRPSQLDADKRTAVTAAAVTAWANVQMPQERERRIVEGDDVELDLAAGGELRRGRQPREPETTANRVAHRAALRGEGGLAGKRERPPCLVHLQAIGARTVLALHPESRKHGGVPRGPRAEIEALRAHRLGQYDVRAQEVDRGRADQFRRPRWPRVLVRPLLPGQVDPDVRSRGVDGLEPEGRKYTPHVSLARLRESSSRQVADYLAVRAPFRSSPFKVSRFVLFSSRASVGGGPYVVEAAYPLAA